MHAAWTPELHARSAVADDCEARGEPRGASWDEARDRILRAVTRR